MTATDRLKGMLEKGTACPICKGTAQDPIPHHQTREIVPCRRCEGTGTISRITQQEETPGVPIDFVILCEQLGPSGELLTQYKKLSLIVDKHQVTLDTTGTGKTNTWRLQTMRQTEDVVIQKCIDTWLAENRGKA